MQRTAAKSLHIKIHGILKCHGRHSKAVTFYPLDKGIHVRVVSMPAQNIFDEQSEAYPEAVLPKKYGYLRNAEIHR